MRLQAPQGLSWSDMGMHLSFAFPYREWREAPWLCVVIGDGDAPARERGFRLVEAPHVQPIESVVERWLADEPTPALVHPASYLLALRFSTIGHLLMSFHGFFPPPPESSVSSLYRKFLLDWWR